MESEQMRGHLLSDGNMSSGLTLGMANDLLYGLGGHVGENGGAGYGSGVNLLSRRLGGGLARGGGLQKNRDYYYAHASI